LLIGSKRKTSDEKRGNPKIQGTQKRKTFDEKKEATPKRKGLKKEKPPMKKE
jgi:hypothetical protein